MAQYGSEWATPRGRRPGWRGRGRWAEERQEYGQEYWGTEQGRRMPRRSTGYGEEMGYGERMVYRAGRGYGAEMGYGTERGYGAQRGYGTQRRIGAWTQYGAGRGAGYEYDYEYGGRGWPYTRTPRMRGRGRMVGYGEEYDWELRRPEGFGMYYGYEYIRSGQPGFRRARGGMPRSREYLRGEEMRGYGEEFAGRGYGAGYEEEFTRGLRGEREWHYGRTPPDRWPSAGHDVSDRPLEEMEMSDREIREAVLENLFQDSWVNPETIDVEVDNGVVTLTGEVRDFMEARYAWDDAWESAGVKGVINNLTVRADIPQEEMEMPQTSGGQKGGGRSRGR